MSLGLALGESNGRLVAPWGDTLPTAGRTTSPRNGRENETVAEVLVQFTSAVAGPNGGSFTARACGRQMDDDRRWEGWIEFVPDSGGAALRTPRESVQPNRQDLHYWATGLTAAYLEGALSRALAPPTRPAPPEPPKPAYDGPAPHTSPSREPVPRTHPHPVLDPFHVFEQGEDVLRQELGALDGGHLRNIVLAYDLAPGAETDLHLTTEPVLVELIVAEVRGRVAR